MKNGSSFIREFDIDLVNKTLSFHQKIEGDVSCVVWDASIVLAKYLEELCRKNEKYMENVKIVELGAGLGCVGLTAACLGAHVILTDLPEVLPLLELNLYCNKHILDSTNALVESKPLLWGQDIDIKFNPDIILLADCVYYEESIVPLIKTLVDLAGQDTTVILTQEMRDSEKQKKNWEYFVTKVKEHFDLIPVPLEDQNPEYSSPDILLLKLRKL